MSESPLSVASLVDEILDTVHGFRTQEQRTTLASTMTTGSTSFTVSDANYVSRGPIEVDDEMMHVATVDPATSTVTLEPWGRGQGGTTTATHSINAMVTSAPVFPRERVRNAIYGVLREIFPDVYGVNSYTLDGSAVRTNYVMPADCWHVKRVESHALGGSLMWAPVTRWRQNKTPTTVELEVLGPVALGTGRVRALYVRTPPTAIVATDDLSTFGYDTQIRDVVVLGAAAKLLAFSESARAQVSTMEGHGRAEVVQSGSALNLAKTLFQMYQKRVDDERRQLELRYPSQPHMTR